jgi:GrpB-like predicted nucleotidyltransferase (UPF0157 family)
VVSPAADDRTPVVLVAYDPAWPAMFARTAAEVRDTLGPVALAVHHIGSTAVPRLSAKPVVDVVLVVADSADEAVYRPALEERGYRLVVREPEWFEHRMFQRGQPRVNLHVFSDGCEEVARVLAFRDHLRVHAADRFLYEETKRRLAQRPWRSVQDYADAKSAVVAEIMTRAMAGDSGLRGRGTGP